jgi:hypothetical protein
MKKITNISLDYLIVKTLLDTERHIIKIYLSYSTAYTLAFTKVSYI